jgi:hypothetical protein
MVLVVMHIVAQVCGTLTYPDGTVNRVTFEPGIEAYKARLNPHTHARTHSHTLVRTPSRCASGKSALSCVSVWGERLTCTRLAFICRYHTHLHVSVGLTVYLMAGPPPRDQCPCATKFQHARHRRSRRRRCSGPGVGGGSCWRPRARCCRRGQGSRWRPGSGGSSSAAIPSPTSGGRKGLTVGRSARCSGAARGPCRRRRRGVWAGGCGCGAPRKIGRQRSRGYSGGCG